ncbi:MAG: 2TM domain-containing protein [Bacteroidetes bacterium]|nr:MAG: 2TM domain-containing protein [Bacteroidota bacterium]
MFSKTSKTEIIDPEQREQYDYARKRINQKKWLMKHFILFLAGSVLLIIINPVLGIGKDFFIENWFAWAILLWALLFMIHLLNVFIMSKFMGKEWEDRQIEKLKAKQEERIAEIKKQVVKEVTVADHVSHEASADRLRPEPMGSDEAQVKKNEDPLQFPAEEG